MATTRIMGGLQADSFTGAMYEHSPFGKVWYVDVANGSDGNSGEAPDQAYAGINAAIDAAVATRGDTIIVAPGTYTITTVLVPKAMMTFRAAVVNPQFPTVTIQANIANLMTVNVSGCRFIGFRFLATGTTITSLVNISNTASINGATFEDCAFEGRVTTGQQIAGIRAIGATTFPTGLVVRRCHFSKLGRSDIWVGVNGLPNAKIEDNSFHIWTDLGCGIGFANTTQSATGSGYIIRNNDFLGSSNSVGIRFGNVTEGAVTAGVIRNNYFAYITATTAITQNAATRSLINNYSGDTGTGGTLVDAGN